MKTIIAVMMVLLASPLPSMANEAGVACVTPVSSWSDLDKMQQGDFSANVHWRDAPLGPTSIGYGPGEDHQYELTLLDGKVYMARPGNGNAVIIRHDPKPDEGAAMLQVATPKAWVQAATLDEINSFDDLNFELDQISEENECGDDVLLPFKISGHARSVTWSMDTEPSRIVTTKDQPVVIVGLYNISDKQKYFMVRGYNIHPHVVMPRLDMAGHLRTIELDGGAALYLPRQ